MRKKTARLRSGMRCIAALCGFMLLLSGCTERTQLKTVIIPESEEVAQAEASGAGGDYGEIKKIYRNAIGGLLNLDKKSLGSQSFNDAIRILGWNDENSIQVASWSFDGNNDVTVYEVDYRYNFYSKLVELKGVQSRDRIATSPDGEYIAYTEIQDESQTQILHLVNTRSGLDRELLVGPVCWQDPILTWSGNGRYLALVYDGVSQTYGTFQMLMVYDTQTQQFRGYPMEGWYSKSGKHQDLVATPCNEGDYVALWVYGTQSAFINLENYVALSFESGKLTGDMIYERYIQSATAALTDEQMLKEYAEMYGLEAGEVTDANGSQTDKVLDKIAEEMLKGQMVISFNDYQKGFRAESVAWASGHRALVTFGEELYCWNPGQDILGEFTQWTSAGSSTLSDIVAGCISQDGDVLFYAKSNGNLYVLPLEDGAQEPSQQPVLVYSGFDCDNSATSWNPGANKLLTCGYDRVKSYGDVEQKYLIIEFGDAQAATQEDDLLEGVQPSASTAP